MLHSLFACAVVASFVSIPTELRLQESEGALAVRYGVDSEWRFPAEGDDITLPAELRSAALGRQLLRTDGLQLSIGPDARIELNADASRVVLRSGSCRIETKRECLVQSGENSVQLRAGASAVFVATRNGLGVRLDAGEAAIASPNNLVPSLKAGNSKTPTGPFHTMVPAVFIRAT